MEDCSQLVFCLQSSLLEHFVGPISSGKSPKSHHLKQHFGGAGGIKNKRISNPEAVSGTPVGSDHFSRRNHETSVFPGEITRQKNGRSMEVAS